MISDEELEKKAIEEMGESERGNNGAIGGFILGYRQCEKEKAELLNKIERAREALKQIAQDNFGASSEAKKALRGIEGGEE